MSNAVSPYLTSSAEGFISKEVKNSEKAYAYNVYSKEKFFRL